MFEGLFNSLDTLLEKIIRKHESKPRFCNFILLTTGLALWLLALSVLFGFVAIMFFIGRVFGVIFAAIILPIMVLTVYGVAAYKLDARDSKRKKLE